MPIGYLFTLEEKRDRQEREDAQERQENMTLFVPFTCNVAMFFYGDDNDGHLFFCPLPIRDLVS